MEIIPKLLRYKYHVLLLLVTGLSIASIAFFAPSFLTVVAYFWPLLVSTALFLVAVVVFGKTSAATSSSSEDDPSSVGRAGVGILDYVVSGPTEPDIEPVAAEVEAEGESLKGDE